LKYVERKRRADIVCVKIRVKDIRGLACLYNKEREIRRNKWDYGPWGVTMRVGR